MSDVDRKSGDYLYLSIYRDLKKRLSDGEFKKGERFPPERQLKDEYDTTHVTVRKALSLLVEEGYIERYSGKGTVVVFSQQNRSVPAVSPIPENAGSVLCLLPLLDWPRRRICEELSRYCTALGIPFNLRPYSEGHEDKILADAMAERNALIIYEPRDFRFESLLEPEKGRVILFGGGDEGSGILSGVFIDLEKGLQDCFAYLKDIGSREIGLVGRRGSCWGNALSAAFQKAAESSAFPENAVPVVEGIGLRNGGEDAARALLTDNPHCRSFICTDDITASGVFNHLMEAGINGVEDLTVIGCGNDPFAELTGLPSLDLNPDRVARLLTGLIDDFRRLGVIRYSRLSVRPELVLRRK